MALGGDQELIAALRTPAGEVWRALGLYREPGQPMFDDGELDFVRRVAPSLAEGARQALLVGEAGPCGPPSTRTGPGRWRCPGAVALGHLGGAARRLPGLRRRPAGGGDRRASHPARIAPLLMSAYGLTEREQHVTRLVLQGALDRG
jgi:hypothetical protein